MTTAPTAPVRRPALLLFTPADPAAQRRFMPEIQGLRALAVALVVLFHLWPARLTGGFVGVDVFFVISGYLITSHLRRELEVTGGIRLGSFYARRIRRLLPASLLVLAVTAVAAVAILPPQLVRAAGREVLASTLYVQNLWLASRAVTYSASNEVASPVQHYWSLSTEEQFYAVWPALMLLGVWLGRRWLAGRTTLAIAMVLGTLALASLVHSVVLTAADPAAAYFVTTTRVWEFATGAMTSFFLARCAPTRWVALALRWLGLAAIVVTAWTISQSTPFPGAVALAPVLGTAAVIVAGDTGRRDPTRRLDGLRPVQWLGDASYSVYLWHWPLIVFVPFLTGHLLRWPEKLAVAAATAVLAEASRRWVEQPFLTPRLRAARPARTFAAAGLAMAVLVGGTLGHATWTDRAEAEARRVQLEQLAADPCLGATAALNPAQCGNPFTPPLTAPVTEADSPWLMPSCDPECWEGERPEKVVAVVGDSHAQVLYHALVPALEPQGYGFALFLQGACPLNIAGRDRYFEEIHDPSECGDWSAGVIDRIRELGPDLVVSSAFAESTWSDPLVGVTGYHATWAALTDIAPVVVVRDHPGTGGLWGPECLAKNEGEQEACSVLRSVALPPDLAYEAAGDGAPAGVTRVDLTDLFCDAQRCHAVVGGLPVYWDKDHLTSTFARSLAPALSARMELP